MFELTVQTLDFPVCEIKLLLPISELLVWGDDDDDDVVVMIQGMSISL